MGYMSPGERGPCWRRKRGFFRPMIQMLLVVHDTAKTGVAPVAVSCVSVRLPLAIVFGVVRVNVVGHFSRRSDSGDVQAALHAADLSIKRRCVRSDDGDRQIHTGKTCRSQKKERVPNHMREIALSRSCGNRSGTERLYQFVKLTFSKASHYELKGDTVRSGFRWIPRNGQHF